MRTLLFFVVAIFIASQAEDLRTAKEDTDVDGPKVKRIVKGSDKRRRLDSSFTDAYTGFREMSVGGTCYCYGQCPVPAEERKTTDTTDTTDCDKHEREKEVCDCGGICECHQCRPKRRMNTTTNTQDKKTTPDTPDDPKTTTDNAPEDCDTTFTNCGCDDECQCIRNCNLTKTSDCFSDDLKTDCPCDRRCECQQCKRENNGKCVSYTNTWCECENDGEEEVGTAILAPYIFWPLGGGESVAPANISTLCGEPEFCYEAIPDYSSPCGDFDRPCPATMWDESSMSVMDAGYRCGKCFEVRWRNEFYATQDANWLSEVEEMGGDLNFEYPSYVTKSCPDLQCDDVQESFIVKIVDVHKTACIAARPNYADNPEWHQVDLGLGQNGWQKICPVLCQSGQCVKDASHCAGNSMSGYDALTQQHHGLQCGSIQVLSSSESPPRSFQYVEVNCTKGFSEEEGGEEGGDGGGGESKAASFSVLPFVVMLTVLAR